MSARRFRAYMPHEFQGDKPPEGDAEAKDVSVVDFMFSEQLRYKHTTRTSEFSTVLDICLNSLKANLKVATDGIKAYDTDGWQCDVNDGGGAANTGEYMCAGAGAWASLYTYYCVKAFAIELELIGQGNANVWYTLNFDSTTTLSGFSADIMNQAVAKNAHSGWCRFYGAGEPARIQDAMLVADVLGVDPDVVETQAGYQGTLGATYGTSTAPTSGVWAHLRLHHAPSTGGWNFETMVNVKMLYHTELRVPKTDVA